MTAFVALLRAVNVGGTGALAMADLRRLARAAGFDGVRTYIASGNLVFDSTLEAGEAKAVLEQALQAHAGRPVGVILRDAAEMAAILADNPFRDAPGSRTVAIFLDKPPGPGALDTVTNRAGERLHLGRREIYVHYPDGIGQSKLRIPLAAQGTARNLNTVTKLAAMSAAGSREGETS